MEGNMINGLALCAGTGGLELGTHIAIPGLRTVCYVEREAAAAASLVARMEDKTLDTAPVWDNLGTFDGKPWRGVVDLITSGDPCQPNSAAGKRQGEDDDRWLLDQVLRIIDEIRPSRVFRENVTGNADGQLRVFVPALEAMGYRVTVGIFAASEVGASHRRERLFILADAPSEGWRGQLKAGIPAKNGRAGLGGSGEILAYADSGELRPNTRKPIAAPDGRHNASGGCTDMANAKCEGPQGARSENAEWRCKPSPLCRTRGTPPLFAPEPGDLESWFDILAERPDLTPAISHFDIAQIAGRVRRLAQDGKMETAKAIAIVRGISNGLAYRHDRLRQCGNGVLPLEAAYAYATLAAHFDAAGTGSTDAVLSVQ